MSYPLLNPRLCLCSCPVTFSCAIKYYYCLQLEHKMQQLALHEPCEDYCAPLGLSPPIESELMRRRHADKPLPVH